MKILFHLTAWEFLLQVRYHILTVIAVITAMYCGIFLYFDTLPNWFVAFLIATDPTMLGFLFIGVLVLFEKSSNTVQALVVTPIKKYQYLGAKALSLTCIALFASILMALASQREVNYLVLALAVVLSSIHFIWIGFLGVVRVKTINQYFFVFPFIITPVMLPLLNFWGFTDWLVLYVFPFQACLLLFQAAFEPILWWQWLYALIYLPLTTLGVYVLATKFYDNYLINS